MNIFLFDDHGVVIDGLRKMLNGEPDITIVGDATSGAEALEKISKLLPDIVTTGIKQPDIDGIELTRRIKAKHPEIKVLIITLLDQYYNQAIEAGADGYLLKDVKKAELLAAIRAVSEGKKPIASQLKPPERLHPQDSDHSASLLTRYPHVTPAFIVAVILSITFLDLPYGYYQILRWVTCGVALFIAYQAYTWKQYWAIWIFGIIAILFNPILPITFSKEIWLPIDWVTAAIFVLGIFLLHEPLTDLPETPQETIQGDLISRIAITVIVLGIIALAVFAVIVWNPW